jgi:hypothetical protein
LGLPAANRQFIQKDRPFSKNSGLREICSNLKKIKGHYEKKVKTLKKLFFGLKKQKTSWVVLVHSVMGHTYNL